LKPANLIPVILAALALSSCATQPHPSAQDLPGFFWGLLHGFIVVFSLIGSAFWDVRIYSFPNSGGWYDFGFVLGVACFFGGGFQAKFRYER
jgi:hypothetical protein